jgi:chromosome segregation ATPase
VDVDPDLAYEAAEESRRQAGENVIAAIGAQITEMRAEMEMRFSELKSENAEMRAEFKAENAEIRSEVKAQGARVDALGSRIDTLQKVIWPLMVILATSVFGLLYKAVTG